MALATRPKPTLNDRKRQAGHHRHSKSYLSHYWPYLPMLMIVGLGLVVNGLWSKGNVLGAQTGFSDTSLLAATNAQRTQDGEQLLSLNSHLEAAAQAKANDMVRYDYWAHNSPAGQTPWSFITASGYRYDSAGENLAYGFSGSSAAITGWMNSPEHRANILNDAYTDVGFGIATSPDFIGQGPQTVLVAEYAQPTIGSSSQPVINTSDGQVLGARTYAQRVSRIQLLTGNQSEWSILAVVVLSSGAMLLFALRHGYRLHRWLSRGELFATQHPFLDIFIVLVITSGCVLTRVSGIVG